MRATYDRIHTYMNLGHSQVNDFSSTFSQNGFENQNLEEKTWYELSGYLFKRHT